jgi:hypothetical protein
MDNTASSTRETSPTSVTELLTLVDWTALPAETRKMIQTVGPLMQEGCSRAEISRRLGWKDAQTTAAMNLIRDAILDQCRAMVDDLEPRLRDLVLALDRSR